MARTLSDIMTANALATCSPDTPVANVAKMMRDRNIGDVLVTDGGQLRGIVTDRDITTRVVAGDQDPRQVPVSNFMSSHLVTGDVDWSLDRAASVMGDNQIRRLPVMQGGRLVGVVSLGDIALNLKNERETGESLKEISEPAMTHQMQRGGFSFMGLLLMALGAVATAMFLTGDRGRELRDQFRQTDWSNTARDVANEAYNRFQDTDWRGTASETSQRLQDVQWRNSLRDTLRQAADKLEQAARQL